MLQALGAATFVCVLLSSYDIAPALVLLFSSDFLLATTANQYIYVSSRIACLCCTSQQINIIFLFSVKDFYQMIFLSDCWLIPLPFLLLATLIQKYNSAHSALPSYLSRSSLRAFWSLKFAIALPLIPPIIFIFACLIYATTLTAAHINDA